MAGAGRRGWIVFPVEVGSDPNNQSGMDFRPWSSQDFGIICRINNGYGSAGTIPHSSQYANFAKRVANFVAASPGCKIWVIGNEMNHSQERPAIPSPTRTVKPTPPLLRRGPNADPTGHGDVTRFSALAPAAAAAPAPSAAARTAGFEVITPALYADCFRQCRDAIKLVPGHGDDQVITGAVAPWNNETVYPGNPEGDWVKYFSDMLAILGPAGLDGMALHTYTHGSDPALITDTSKMNAPFQNRFFNFQSYRDFMNAIPAADRTLPVYITETDQDVPWLDENNGWVQAAYSDINGWNQQPNAQQIRALVLYRWPPYDQWYIQGKQGVIDGFRAAMVNDYRWKAPPPKPADFQAGDTVKTLDIVNFRQSPGGPTIATLPADTQLKVISSQFVRQNNLIWWNLRRQLSTGSQDGWIAQVTGDGIVLLEEVPVTPPPAGSFKPGDLVLTQTIVRMRKTPGTTNKPADDVVADVPASTVLTVASGPRTADGLTWWQNQGKLPDGRQVSGWQAEALADGTRLLEKYTPPVAPPNIVLPPTGVQVGDHYRTTTIVRLRKTAGSANKAPDDIVAEIQSGANGTVVSGPTNQDNMRWWFVTAPSAAGQELRGWMAEALPDGTALMEKVAAPADKFTVGDLAVTADFANVRSTPGITDKPSDDVLGVFAPGAVLKILGGPEDKDGLRWWRVGGVLTSGDRTRGSVAESAPGGAAILDAPASLPGTNIPDKRTGAYLNAPYDGNFGIAQLWGENPGFYSQYNYDGVALLGHNGVDFLAPSGTLLYAVDAGEVARTGFEEGGFGNFILIRHAWGESLYAHLQSIAVSEGQPVARGQFIGVSDNTGGSTGPHLHFAVRINPYNRADGWGGFTTPLPYLPPTSFTLPVDILDPATLSIAAAMPIPAQQDKAAEPPAMGDIPGDQRP